MSSNETIEKFHLLSVLSVAQHAAIGHVDVTSIFARNKNLFLLKHIHDFFIESLILLTPFVISLFNG